MAAALSLSLSHSLLLSLFRLTILHCRRRRFSSMDLFFFPHSLPPSGLGHLTTLLPSLWWGKPITLLRRLLLSLMMLRRAKENGGRPRVLGVRVRRVRNREREKWTTYCGCHVSGALFCGGRERPSFLNSNERGKGPKKRWEDLACAGRARAGRLEKTE